MWVYGDDMQLLDQLFASGAEFLSMQCLVVSFSVLVNSVLVQRFK